MSENFIRHFISFMAVLVCALAYFSGYWSAGRGWWWTALGLGVIYILVYKLLKHS